MALNFPASPTIGQSYVSGNTTWEWDGSRWVNVSATTLTLGTLTSNTVSNSTDYFAIEDGNGDSWKIQQSNIDISGFNNDSGFDNYDRFNFGTFRPDGSFGGSVVFASSHTIESLESVYISQTETPIITANVVANDTMGLGGGVAVDLGLQLKNLSTSTNNNIGDYFVVTDDSGSQYKLTKSSISLSGFNNDAGYTSYTNSSVDSHLNTSTASSGEYLSWNGSDYDWTTVPEGYANGDVDSHLNTSGASADQLLSWTGSDYSWIEVSGGGATSSSGYFEHNKIITENVSITDNHSAFSVGDIEFANGVNISLGANSSWTVIPDELKTINGNSISGSGDIVISEPGVVLLQDIDPTPSSITYMTIPTTYNRFRIVIESVNNSQYEPFFRFSEIDGVAKGFNNSAYSWSTLGNYINTTVNGFIDQSAGGITFGYITSTSNKRITAILEFTSYPGENSSIIYNGGSFNTAFIGHAYYSETSGQPTQCYIGWSGQPTTGRVKLYGLK